MTDQFTIDLDQAEQAATQQLPMVAEMLREPVNILRTHEGMSGFSDFPPATSVQNCYSAITDFLSVRQAAASYSVSATAEALKQIVDVYRRIDGQG